MTMNARIETERLVLEPWSPAHIVVLIESPDRFEEVTGLRAADGLRSMFVSGDASEEWLASLRQHHAPDPSRFGFRVMLGRENLIVGTSGFKTAADDVSVLEIAYGVAPPYEGRGYATEVAAALTDYAFNEAGVDLVIAHTLAEPNASTRVLTKCGFVKVMEFVDPDDGPVWRWETSRGLEP
jgi:RimJ/RimL family protein N-acetyltransferase